MATRRRRQRNTSIDTSSIRRDAARRAAAALAGDDAAAGRQIPARDGGRRAAVAERRARRASGEEDGRRRSARSGGGGGGRQVATRAGEARRAVDDYVVAHARGLRDAGGRGGGAAICGVAGTAASVRGARGDGTRRAPAGARRPATVAFARRRGPRSRDAYAVLLKAARRAGIRGAARTPDALGGKARDYVAVAPIAPRFFPAPTRRRRPRWSALRWWARRCFCAARALGWNWTGWDWSALERRDDVAAAPQDIPHGDSFGLAPPNTTTLGAFARDPGGMYVFDAGAAADALFAMGDVRRRVEALVRPSRELDELLDGFPRRLHAREHGRNAQVYAGPAGAGAHEPARKSSHRQRLSTTHWLIHAGRGTTTSRP